DHIVVLKPLVQRLVVFRLADVNGTYQIDLEARVFISGWDKMRDRCFQREWIAMGVGRDADEAAGIFFRLGQRRRLRLRAWLHRRVIGGLASRPGSDRQERKTDPCHIPTSSSTHSAVPFGSAFSKASNVG